MKKGTVTVLGSATSMGVPTIGCDCAVCHSDDPRDRRTRPSVMVEWEGHRIVIDSGPDFREQAIREGINRLDAVLYTHGHADHILGLDDLRPLTYPRVTGGGRLPLYATPETARILRSVFKYVFDEDYKYGGIAKVELREITGPFELLDLRVIPVPVMHGDAEIIGYRDGTLRLSDGLQRGSRSVRSKCCKASSWSSWMRCAMNRIPPTRRWRIR